MYCRNCGNLINKEERFCSKCGVENSNSSRTQAINNGIQNNTIISKRRTYTPIVIFVAIGMFFVFTFISIFVRILEVNSNTLNGILSIFQIGIPILLFVFGLPISIIVDIINKNRAI